MIYRDGLTLSTQGHTDIIDITQDIEEIVHTSGVKEGILCLFVPGSTASVTTIEAESGVINDLKSAIDRMAPVDISYEHDRRWGDGNGHAHVRAAILGPSLSMPVSNGKLLHGTWQQIVLIDFDNRPRERNVHVHIIGE
jgi:secondary thiamine-phosphate synthase enzyme